MINNFYVYSYTREARNVLTKLYELLDKDKKYIFLFYESGRFCFILPSKDELYRLNSYFGWYIYKVEIYNDGPFIVGHGRYNSDSLSAFLWYGYDKVQANKAENTLSLKFPDTLVEDYYPYLPEFKRSFRISGSICDYLFDYYPINQLCNLNEQQKKERNLLFHFKDGLRANELARIFSYAINRKYDDNKNTVLMTIPASTWEKTEQRYLEFTELLSWYSHIPSAYHGISFKNDIPVITKDRFNKSIEHLEFHSEYFYGKHVYLIDDVITSGTIFRLIAAELKRLGAYSVHGLFFAKTFNEHYKLT